MARLVLCGPESRRRRMTGGVRQQVVLLPTMLPSRCPPTGAHRPRRNIGPLSALSMLWSHVRDGPASQPELYECHVTPVTTNSGRRRSTSRRMTPTTTSPDPRKRCDDRHSSLGTEASTQQTVTARSPGTVMRHASDLTRSIVSSWRVHFSHLLRAPTHRRNCSGT